MDRFKIKTEKESLRTFEYISISIMTFYMLVSIEE